MSIAAGLLACASYKKPLPSLAPPRRGNDEVFKFSDKARETRLVTIVHDLPLGYQYGEAGSSLYGSGNSCAKKQPLVNTQGRFELKASSYTDVFNSVMKRHGYPVDDQVELFKGSKEHVADLQVGARIIDATLNECYPKIAETELKAVGSAYLKIEWSIYSAIEKKVVFVTITEGSTYGDVESTIGEPGILRPALADAAERLAADPKYRQVVDPAQAGAPIVAAVVGRMKIRPAKQFVGPLKSNLEAIRKAAVTVSANRGSGSGFAISEDGTVVTAEHVVSGSRYVKVNTAAGKECYGEVAASNKQRDLAVLKLDCSGLTALPLSRGKVIEGNEVFAIGTPLSDKLQFSVTKGVISGLRKIEELDYIQSDVTVLPGSSGGPLLDSSGNVVGVTAGGIGAGGAPVGVNFFIPLLEIEKYLPIDFE